MHVLERMKEVKKLPMLGRKWERSGEVRRRVMIPMLKKRDVELVLNTLREQCECLFGNKGMEKRDGDDLIGMIR